MSIFIYTIHLLFVVFTLILMARLLGSWFPQFQHTRFYRFLCHYSDPYLNIFRRIIPPLGMIDFSPVIALIALQILEKIIIFFLIRL